MHDLIQRGNMLSFRFFFIIVVLICFSLFILLSVLASPCYSMDMSICFLSVRCDLSLNQRLEKQSVKHQVCAKKAQKGYQSQVQCIGTHSCCFQSAANQSTTVCLHSVLSCSDFLIPQSKYMLYIHLQLSFTLYNLERKKKKCNDIYRIILLFQTISKNNDMRVGQSLLH